MDLPDHLDDATRARVAGALLDGTQQGDNTICIVCGERYRPSMSATVQPDLGCDVCYIKWKDFSTSSWPQWCVDHAHRGSSRSGGGT